MNKKGQDLPVTTIIVIILVVVVLVVVIAFFLGGTSSLTTQVKRIFFGTTAGYDLTLATQTCADRCEQAKNLPIGVRPRSAYCISSLAVDMNPLDGEADSYIDSGGKKKTKNYYCPSSDMAPGFSTDSSKELLNVPCDLGDGVTCIVQTVVKPEPVTSQVPPERRSGSGPAY